MIFAQLKRAVARLGEEEQARLSVAAITLDPENDTQEVLMNLSEVHELPAPQYNFLGGDPIYVNDVLDRYGFRRKMNKESGQLDHNNLFIVIDKKGEIAFTLSLGETQEDWLVEALKTTLAEKHEASSAPKDLP